MRKMLWFGVVVVAVCVVVVAAPPPGKDRGSQLAASIDHDTYINANNILMFVTNHANYCRDLSGVFGQDAGTFYPYISNAEILNGSLTSYVMYAAGLWMGGKVGGQTRVAIAEYSDEYVPGPMQGGTYMDDQPEFRVYKLYRDSLEDNPNDDYLNWPVDQGAPLDHVGRPLMRGEQMLWTVFNDADPVQHNNDAGETPPLGIEVRQSWWAFDSEPTGEAYVGGNVEVTHSGSSLAQVRVEVVDAAYLTGHDYRVTFTDEAEGPRWHLEDVTMASMVLTDQEPMQPGEDWVTADGFAVWVQCDNSGFVSFEVTANGAGPLDPPESGAFPWAGFPCPTAVDPDGYPTEGQQVGEGLWGIHTADNGGTYDGGTRGSFDAFVDRITRNGDQAAAINSYDFEIRFTGSNDNPGVGGGYAIEWYNDDNVFWVPYELWNIGIGTPDDPSDDFRMVSFIIDDAGLGPPFNYEGDDMFSLESWGSSTLGGGDLEHSVSGQANDPFTDWIYWFNPYDTSPGTAGYDAAEAAMLAGTFPSDVGDLVGDQVISRMVLVNWNGDTATTDQTTGRFNQDCPEQGTVFRIRTGKGFAQDTFTFTPEAPQTVPTGGPGNAIYVEYILHNKGGNQIDDCYLTFWGDVDLGDHTDDLVGCDTLHDIFFAYNGAVVDRQFGGRPPAVGWKVIYGPLVPSAGDTAMFGDARVANHRNLGMTACSKFINGTDPNNYQETYNYMQGLMPDGSPYYYNAQPLTYMHSGDPVTEMGDLDYDPADRRMMATCGPFTFLPDDSQYVLLKLAVGQGTDRLSSITKLKEILNSGPEFVCGDVNDDGSGPDIVDLVYLVNYMFRYGPWPAQPLSADVYGGGNGIDIADLVYLVDYMFKYGPDLQCEAGVKGR